MNVDGKRHRVERRPFLAYGLQVTLKQLMVHAPGWTPASVMAQLATIQMIDVCIPTVDDRWLILPRYTQPDTDTKMLLHQLHLELPAQPPPASRPPPSISASEGAAARLEEIREIPLLW